MLHDCVGGGVRVEKNSPGGRERGRGASYVLLPVHALKVNQR
jgi:hypothetical protein